MDSYASARTEARTASRPWAAAWATLIAVVALMIGIAGCQSTAQPSSLDDPDRDAGAVTVTADGIVDESDGLLPADAAVLDDAYPGVTQLDPELLEVLRQAAADAAEQGIPMYVTSGWRSAEYQNQLLTEAITEYGSKEEAARWVATAETSAHVSGDAVDIGPYDAISWMQQLGPRYGLCQIYSNEPWHYELRPEAAHDGCPRMYTDPTQDPRLQ